MPSLPTLGENPWGAELNEFLLVSHNADGTVIDPLTLTALYLDDDGSPLPASGAVRLANTSNMYARNGDNDGDMEVISMGTDGGDGAIQGLKFGERIFISEPPPFTADEIFIINTARVQMTYGAWSGTKYENADVIYKDSGAEKRFDFHYDPIITRLDLSNAAGLPVIEFKFDEELATFPSVLFTLSDSSAERMKFVSTVFDQFDFYLTDSSGVPMFWVQWDNGGIPNYGAPGVPGDTLLYIHDLPDADPAVLGSVWNDAGTLKISLGP